MSAYLSAVLADNPFHYWRHGESGGQVAIDVAGFPLYLSGNGGHGYTGPVSDGGSMWCDGSVNKGSVSGQTLHLIAPVTVELWFWPISIPASGALCAWDNTNNPSLALFAQTNNTVTFAFSGSPVLTSAVFTLQSWHHVVAAWSGTTMTLTVDGVSQSAAFSTALNAQRLIGFGEMPVGGGSAFDGALSEIAMYATALSNARALAHFNAADRVGFPPTFFGAGTFDVTLKETITDPSQLAKILAAVQKTFPTT